MYTTRWGDLFPDRGVNNFAITSDEIFANPDATCSKSLRNIKNGRPGKSYRVEKIAFSRQFFFAEDDALH